jgi:hypothetical protein
MQTLQQSWVQSQLSPAQWNLRGGRLSSVDKRTLKIFLAEMAFLKIIEMLFTFEKSL